MWKLPTFLWLLLPPSTVLVALLVMRPEHAAEATTANPGFYQIAGSLLIALFAGGVGAVITTRLRQGHLPRGQGPALFRLVQSLRISSSHSVHAIEFESRLLLVGICDGNMVLLDAALDDADTGQVPQFSDDGVDLLDTPVAEKDLGQQLRNLTDASRSQQLGRAALTEANLAEFKKMLKHARRPSRV